MSNILKKIKRILWRTTKAIVTMFLLPLTFFVIGCSPVLSIILTICFLKIYKKIRNNKFTLNLKIIPASNYDQTAIDKYIKNEELRDPYDYSYNYNYNYGSDI